jgi:hypothetical protein
MSETKTSGGPEQTTPEQEHAFIIIAAMKFRGTSESSGSDSGSARSITSFVFLSGDAG